MTTGAHEEFRRLGTQFLQLPIGRVEAAKQVRRAA
jgi:hypothetical protein